MSALSRKKGVVQVISLILLIAFLNLIHGCYYYKVQKSTEPETKAVASFQANKKFIILHSGTEVWQFSGISVGQDTIRGRITRLIGHTAGLKAKPDQVNRYRKEGPKSTVEVLNEVHVYAFQYSLNQDGTISIPVNKINKIEVYDPAKGATVASWVFSIGAIALPVIAIVVALTKQSCPFIYVSGDTSTVFAGEIYSGAFYPSLERQDWLPLPSPGPGQTDYRLLMTNEVHEIQNTNLAELVVIDHPSGTQAYIDKYGICQTTGIQVAPSKATNLNGKDILDIISRKDTLSWFGNPDMTEKGLKDGIIMSFAKPANATTAKLVVNAKSTFWLDYVFTRFHQLFGTQYDCWVDKQEKIPPRKTKTWMLEQNIPLSVYIENKGKWQFVDYYNIVGPMALKEDILAFDISGIKTDSLKVKLEYGNFFWDVDYAAIDFSVNVPVVQRTVELASAVDEQEKDVRDLLTSADMLYYVQPEIGNAVDMEFKLPYPAGEKRSLILHSQGHYRILMDATGEQQKRELMAFLKKGHFPKFSNQLLQKQTSGSE